jgi:DNA-binding NtrC family response regulator
MGAAVAVCGTERSSVDAGVALVRAAGSWDTLPVLDQRSFELAKASASGFVLMGDSDRLFRLRVSERPSHKPLIAIGGEPVPDATCWLPQATTPKLFSALLLQLLGSERPGASLTFRRKGDMIVGNGRAFQKLLAELNLITPSSAPVLIGGESGTGKDLVAQSVHYCGPRASKPYIALNCGAIPEALFEAELFGYQRGAFTGAVSSRAGAFEAADGGTLFLDEIGELPLSMQVKLLRVLESYSVTRLGTNEPKKVDFRLVAATNRDLEADVAAGRFRQDLYYRVRVFTVNLPSLRERVEDIPEILAHHLGLIAEREKRPVPVLTPAALQRVLSYPWPGNVRQLVNTVHRALVVCEGNMIDTRHLELPDESSPLIQPFGAAKALFEADYYRRLMKAAGGNVSLAAKLAEKTRKEIYDAFRRLGLTIDSFRK